ncbi:MAG: penicillin acylase family protein, partial [Acidobacteriota bacterium]|nr:penicillin acylase family protein [Acidobacteriota bacterium]
MRRLTLLVLGLALALMGSPMGAQSAAPAVQTTSLTVSGLEQPVEIRRDRWGINHIYARNEPDLFFAQGYAAAKDRLFQFELWRRQATGTVAEILGRRELERDRGARLHMFRGDLDAELNHYHPRGKTIIESFVRGINAYIAETERNPALLPIEFTLLGITPGRWTPAVVISRHQGLADNVTSEARNMRALKVISAETLAELMYFQGGTPVFAPDAALDPKTFPDDVLALYDAFRTPVQFQPEDVAAQFRATPRAAALAERPTPDAPLPTLDTFVDPRDIGSNNWVVSGARTQSTFPIMANDPHRAQGAPSLRYWVHLVAPGWNVIGGGEPVLPGVSIGHNEYGAWGLTIFGNDSEDLYVYDVNPANPNEYRYQDHWEAVRVVADTIPVEGEKPVSVELKYTRHGPVIYEDRANRKAYALRTAWLEPGSAPYLSSLRMDQARTWEEFREACGFNRMPAENMVWADRTGTIGWQAAGIQPLRRNWSGLLPVPGDGRYEWDGYLPITALPHEVNPPRGFVATANHYLFPNDYPYPEAMHYTWADPYRASRITEVLGSGRLFSPAEMARLQNDDLSIPARALVPLLKDLSFSNPASVRARDAVVSWDFVMDKGSAAAGVYAMWQRRLLGNVRDILVPREARATLGAGVLSTKRVIDWLYAPDGRFGADPVSGRDALVARSLDEAVAELTKRFGPDMATWQWGQNAYHHALIRHPLSAAVNDATRARLDVGPAPRGGDGSTVSATGNGDNQ